MGSGAAIHAACTAADQAASAVRLVLSTPGPARQLALEAARLAEDEGDLSAASTAERALGLVAMQLEHFDAAAVHLHRAVALGAGDAQAAAQARMNLAYVLSRQGRTAQALQQIELAAPVLRGLPAAWLAMYEALVLKGLGRWEAALAAYRRALPVFRRAGDQLGEARLRANRGVLHLYRGAYNPAESDLLRAEELFGELGQELNTAIVWHNLGCVAAGLGDAPAALARFERAERLYEKHRRPPATLWMDRCEFALSMGLAVEAVDAAEQAVEELHRMRQPADLAEARLLLAQSRLLDGDPVRALAIADQAARAFVRQRRPRWASLARYTVLQACLAGGPGHRARSQDAARAATALERGGWTYRALDARLTAGRLALEEGRVKVARHQLGAVAAWRLRGPMLQRAQAWHAEALLRQADGDRLGARRAVSRGLVLLEDHHAVLGATDLRASTAGHFIDLAQLGLTLAAGSPPRTVLAWAERVRAAYLLRRPVRPPGDEVLARDLAELRHVVTELWAATAAGRRTDGLRSRQVTLERDVRDQYRLARDAPAGRDRRAAPPPSVADLAGALNDRALIEYVEVDGCLHALTLAAGRLRLHQLGATDELSRELQMLPFLLGRLASSTGSAASRQAAEHAAGYVARRMDAALLLPLLPDIGERPVVLVPTAALQGVPWSLLASCRRRPVSVAPSARLWHRAATRDPQPADGPVALVAGPGLPGARDEVLALAALYGQERPLLDGSATVGRVSAALQDARLAHVATHGVLRADNPQFSCLQLHDGPLTVYDLEQLPQVPSCVVLSACDTGRGVVLPGGAVLGLVSAFLSLGSTALIASLLPVSDPDAPQLMVDVHLGLRRGDRPAAALADAQAHAYARGQLALAAGLVCFGAG